MIEATDEIAFEILVFSLDKGTFGVHLRIHDANVANDTGFLDVVAKQTLTLGNLDKCPAYHHNHRIIR